MTAEKKMRGGEGRKGNRMQALHQDRLQELADNGAQVLIPQHDTVRDPWPVERLRPVMEKLVAKSLSFRGTEDDFAVRKQCLEDTEIQAFQRAHPKLYWLLTDRSKMRDSKARDVINAFLSLREQVERGAMSPTDSDAHATRAVMTNLQRTE